MKKASLDYIIDILFFWFAYELNWQNTHILILIQNSKMFKPLRYKTQEYFSTSFLYSLNNSRKTIHEWLGLRTLH